jgi:flagellar hook protein FlgE
MPLIGTLTSGVSALTTFSKGLEVIGGNIANVNTTAYKGASTSFADTFSNTVASASGSAQIGSGVQLGGITTNYTQGSLTSTGKTTDLGVSASGYFVVKDASGGVSYATRDGSFHFDTSNILVNAQGKQVLSSTGAAIDITSAAAAPKPAISSVNIATDGTVNVSYADGTTNSAAAPKIGLLNFPDQSKLSKQGDNLYDFSNSGVAAAAIGTATVAGATIQSGALELSNVDLTQQFADLISMQRSFQAGARLVTVSDSVLDDIVNLKRS